MYTSVSITLRKKIKDSQLISKFFICSKGGVRKNQNNTYNQAFGSLQEQGSEPQGVLEQLGRIGNKTRVPEGEGARFQPDAVTPDGRHQDLGRILQR